MRALIQRVTHASVTIVDEPADTRPSTDESADALPDDANSADVRPAGGRCNGERPDVEGGSEATQLDGVPGGTRTDDTRSIGAGYVILLGVGQQDTEQDADKLWHKISRLRIFADDAGKTNLSLADIGGDVLIVSQFTLFASCKKGNRPSFTQAGAPDMANLLYQYFVGLARADAAHVQTGEFGAHMQVSLVNDGPFTICLDTDEL